MEHGRWIKLRIIFQPSEISKIGLILAFAGYFTDSKIDLSKKRYSIFWPLVGMIIPIFILYKVENHLSAAIIIGVVSFVMLLMSGIDMKHFMINCLILLGGGVGAATYLSKKNSDSFRVGRVETWLHTEEYAQNKGYQTMQGLYAIGSGGPFGVGLGNSTQKYSYVPAAHNDFIFAILVEELGFVGAFFVIVLFILFGIRGYIISLKADNKFDSLVTIGITTLIMVQAILNIAVVTNSIPNTGISLPFFSYGGTSLVILMMSVGIILNISKRMKN